MSETNGIEVLVNGMIYNVPEGRDEVYIRNFLANKGFAEIRSMAASWSEDGASVAFSMATGDKG